MAKRGRPKKRKIKIGFKKKTIFSIMAIFLAVFSLMTLFSFLRQVVILAQLNDLLKYFFGWGAILVPFLLLLLSLFFSRLKTPLTSWSVLIGFFLFFFSVASLGQLGALGNFLWRQLNLKLGVVVAFAINISVLVIGLIVLFDTSIEQIVAVIKSIGRVIGGYLFMGKKTEKGQYQKAKKLGFVGEKERREISGKEIKSMVKEQKEKNMKIAQLSTLKIDNSSPTIGIPGATQGIWRYPPLSLLSDKVGGKADRGNIEKNASIIERTLDSFGITAHVAEVNPGPAVTQYAIEVALGTKLSKITNLANDLALSLAAPTGQIRIEAPIPGRSLAGIELPNRSSEIVTIKQMLSSKKVKREKSKLAVALGLGVSGEPIIVDIDKMPHVLIAGQTGAGKSVLLNSWIASLLFRTTPEEVKLILIDPKRVEFSLYAGIPHLKSSIIVEPKEVVSALEWAIGEMEDRYKKFAKAEVRNIASYNKKSGFASLPYLLIIIDELADVMLFAPSEVEERICRLAQMARATGIHLIIATQRPSVDILTGLIKANIPCRISCAVASSVDSRVILDTPGAEKLLGRGDMLYLPPNRAKPLRVQGTFVTEKEIKKLIKFLKNTGIEPVYTEEVIETPVKKNSRGGVQIGDEERDDFFDEAITIIFRYDRASASLLQRRLSIGYNRAARILDQLHAAQIVGTAEGSKPREILVSGISEARRLAAQEDN